jgi:hypothetical protein
MSSKYYKNFEYAKKGPSQTKRTMIVDPKEGVKSISDYMKGKDFPVKEIRVLNSKGGMNRTGFRSGSKSPAWQRKEGKSESGGLNKKGVASYRAANPGSKLKTAVTTKPSKLKKGSKAAKRRKSFCARMKGMKKRLTSAKTARDPDSRINKSLRKWNC